MTTTLKEVKAEQQVVTVEFVLKAEMKHSVRYNAISEDPAVTAAYVMKTSLPTPYPKKFKMQLIFEG